MAIKFEITKITIFMFEKGLFINRIMVSASSLMQICFLIGHSDVNLFLCILLQSNFYLSISEKDENNNFIVTQDIYYFQNYYWKLVNIKRKNIDKPVVVVKIWNKVFLYSRSCKYIHLRFVVSPHLIKASRLSSLYCFISLLRYFIRFSSRTAFRSKWGYPKYYWTLKYQAGI